MDLTDRKKQILKAVVEDYVSTAEPVGSKAIAAQMEGRISSATIRNELADLVEQDIWSSPTPPPGACPLPSYRLYVNELMERQKLSVAETEKLNSALKNGGAGSGGVSGGKGCQRAGGLSRVHRHCRTQKVFCPAL